MCVLRINLPNLCTNMNHFNAVDFSECHSEEVMFLLTLSVKINFFLNGLRMKFQIKNAACTTQLWHDGTAVGIPRWGGQVQRISWSRNGRDPADLRHIKHHYRHCSSDPVVSPVLCGIRDLGWRPCK